MTLEFLVIFPSFLILCLFTIELGFWSIDRHLLKLATFDAARSMLSQQYDEQLSIATSCEDSLKFPHIASDERAKKTSLVLGSAHRELALKMAYTAPAVSNFLSAVGINLSPNELYGGDSQPKPSSSTLISRSMKHLLLRFPSSFALTQIASCEYNPATQAITIKSRYLRQAKMPLVDRMIWLVFVIGELHKHLNAKGLQNTLRIDLDDFYLGTSLSSPSVSQLKQDMAGLRTKLRDSVGTFASLSLNLNAAALALGNYPFLRKLADASVNQTHQWEQNSKSVAAKLQAIEGEFQASQQAIKNQSYILNAIIFALPSTWRLVPMYESVSLTLAQDSNAENWDGRAFLIAPLAKQSLPDSNVWKQWTRSMQINHSQL